MRTELLKIKVSFDPWLVLALLLLATETIAQGPVIFTDDFERSTLGPEWTSEAYANWSIRDGKAYNAVEGSGGKLATTQRFNATDYVIETVASPFEYGYWREYYLTFGQQNSPDSSYAIRYDAAYGGTLQIVKGTDNVYYPEVLASTKISLNDSEPLKFKVEHFASGTIRLFISELEEEYPPTPLLEAIDHSYPTLGRIGWHISTQTAAQDFFVDKIEARMLLPSPYLFDDDFERDELGDFWAGSEGWTIRDGQAYNAPDNNGSLLTSVPQFEQGNYILETEVSNLVTGYYREYFLLFGQQETIGQNCYVINYDPDFGGVLSLGWVSDNYYYPEILDDQLVNIDPARPYRLRVERYRSGLIQVYLGDENGFPSVPTLEAIDTMSFPLGRVSWACATQTAGEDFFVEEIRAEATDIVKVQPEKPEEDEVIKQFFVNSEHDYAVSKLATGATFYTDRSYTLTEVPSFLENASFVKTANDDKKVKRTDFLKVYLQQPAMAYVAYDPRGTQRPAWLNNWTKIDEVIRTTDPGSNYFEVYTKRVESTLFETYPYQITLGGNRAAPAIGAYMNYLVAFVPVAPSVRYEAENANLNGAQEASNHPGYSGSGFADYINTGNDYVEWSVDLPATAPYELTFKYANGGQNARSLLLSIDEQEQDTLVFNATGSWSGWGYRSAVPALLNAGSHQIRLTAIGSSGPNIDYLQVSPSSASVSGGADFTASRTQSPLIPLAQSTEELPSVVNVFPNPAVDAINFVLGNDRGPGAYLRIMDLRGSEVYAQPGGEQRFLKANSNYILDISHWRTGTYLYQLITGEQVLTGKIIKND